MRKIAPSVAADGEPPAKEREPAQIPPKMAAMAPPNILWIVTTQWRAQACGYAGDPNARTPHLDALAAGAADFAQAVTPHPFGPFARAALLTGIPSPANGVREYFDPLPPDARTIAHALREAGYATAFFGKWHLAPRDPAAPLVGDAHARCIVPIGRRGGFEWWEGFEGGFLLNDPWLHGTGLPEPTPFSGYQSDVVGRRAAAWIAGRAGGASSSRRSADQRPWFVVVSVEPPHPPYGAPAAGVQPLAPEEIELPPTVPRGDDVERTARRELAGYYAHVTATDRAIGALVRSADPVRTIVVVTSVHGDMHGSHGLFRKGWPYEESVRVPLLVRVPEPWAGGDWRGRRRELASLLDLPAWTIRWGRGESFAVPAPAAQILSMPSVVRLQHQCDRVWRALRTSDRKLVLAEAPGATGAFAPWLYFDLARDPGETTNLAAEPARFAEIAGLRRALEPA